ncbi:hypothetical protein J4467_03145 [Candidatus Woesearchaeota archaeon]|nr:hypothetical protein [Candidatus Woesearchaeota archaeon]
MTFNHIALEQKEQMPIAFTALSKRNFFMKEQICTFTLKQGYTPLNPFQAFGYFLNDTVDRNIIRRANNTLVGIAAELWIFGEVSDGVLAEIKQAKEQRKPIKYFKIIESKTFQQIPKEEVVMEDDVSMHRKLL